MIPTPDKMESGHVIGEDNVHSLLAPIIDRLEDDGRGKNGSSRDGGRLTSEEHQQFVTDLRTALMLTSDKETKRTIDGYLAYLKEQYGE